MRLIASAFWIALLPVVATAHHSRVEYVGEAEIEGTLVDILWENPHPAFTIEVEEDGQISRWMVEGWSSLNGFTRAGITRDRFQIGDTIKMFGRVSTRREGRILGTHILMADGTEAIVRREAEPHWGESQNLGGRANWEAGTRAAVVNAVEENTGVFRVWSYPTPDVRTRSYLPLTESAQATRTEWDEFDNYIMRCEPKGMLGA